MDNRSNGRPARPVHDRGLILPAPTPPDDDKDKQVEEPEDSEPVMAPIHFIDYYWRRPTATPRAEVKVESVPEPEPAPIPEPEADPLPDPWARPLIPVGSDDEEGATLLRPLLFDHREPIS